MNIGNGLPEVYVGAVHGGGSGETECIVKVDGKYYTIGVNGPECKVFKKYLDKPKRVQPQRMILIRESPTGYSHTFVNVFYSRRPWFYFVDEDGIVRKSLGSPSKDIEECILRLYNNKQFEVDTIRYKLKTEMNYLNAIRGIAEQVGVKIGD